MNRLRTRLLFDVFLFLVGCLIAQHAFGQISVPAESPEHTLIQVTVNPGMPDGAQFNGGWRLDKYVDYLKIDDSHICLCAPPGTYSLTYRGYWILTESVTFPDGDGNQITIESYLGSGVVDESAEFTVTGGVDPGPGPDPPIPPPGKSWGLILEETGDSSAEWARLRVNLRKAYESSKKTLLILDQSDLPSSLAAIAKTANASGLPLPVLVVVGEDGEVVKALECPPTVAGVQKEVGK